MVCPDWVQGSQDCRRAVTKCLRSKPPAESGLCVWRFQGPLGGAGVRTGAANHDKSVFEIFCYSCTSLRDKVTDEFQRDADKWVDAWRLTDDQLAEQIMSDRIDILVDLSGFTSGNRLSVFARKPAPIQITAWGHATGDGMPQIDYMFSDPVSTPARCVHLFAKRSTICHA